VAIFLSSLQTPFSVLRGQVPFSESLIDPPQFLLQQPFHERLVLQMPLLTVDARIPFETFAAVFCFDFNDQ